SRQPIAGTRRSPPAWPCRAGARWGGSAAAIPKAGARSAWRLQRLPALARDARERGAEGAAALRIAGEHVEARAGGAQEHRFPGLRAGGGQVDGLVEAGGAQDLDARGRDRVRDALRVAADQHHPARPVAYRIGERAEVLALAVAAR